MTIQLTEFECGGRWMCSAVDLGRRNQWLYECRAWNKTPTEFVEMLVKDFQVTKIYYSSDTSFCWWYWDSQVTMRKYKNATNALLRKRSI